MEKVRMNFKVTSEEKERIVFAAVERNVSTSVFIKGCIDDVVDGRCIDRKIVQQKSIELMNALQIIKDKNPNANTSQAERIGGELCQISL